ncbi:MAG: prepilin peptidase [Candidatus Levyibacteriota bacterium]
MLIVFYVLIFIFGTAIGSFLGVVVDRLVNNESILKGRSHCDHCRHNLHPLDLVPLVSFLLLKGKCRYCHIKLSWNYPLIEIVTGASFVIAAFTIFQFSTVLMLDVNYQFLVLYYFALVSSLLAIFFTDLRFGIIPFKLVGFAVVITIFWYLLIPSLYFSPLAKQLLGLQISFLNVIASALCGAGLFFLLFYFTKGRGMGFGDVVYAFLMGFTLGFPKVLLGLYIAFISGAIISLLLVILKKKKLRGGTIPFGPFLVFGTMVSLLWGNILVSYIMHYFIV